jgi:hypothetical protein
MAGAHSDSTLPRGRDANACQKPRCLAPRDPLHEGARADLVRGILDLWPAYLADLTSFLTIGAVWIAHSAITSALRGADGTLYRLNLLVLLVVSFVPFPTKLVGEFIEDVDAERVEFGFYGLTLLALDARPARCSDARLCRWPPPHRAPSYRYVRSVCSPVRR